METINYIISKPFIAKSSQKMDAFVDTMKVYMPHIIDFGVNVLLALLILIVGRFAIKFLVKICNKFFEGIKVDIGIQRFLDSLIKIILNVVLIIVVCDRVGINTASFIAVLGTLGLTIGLALQGSLSNFAGGVLILVLKPFKAGDYIVDNGTGCEGKVDRIDLFYTKIVTGDNRAIFIPNGSLSNSAITNNTEFGIRRVDVEFGIAYDADIDKAKEIIFNIASNDERAYKEKEVSVFVSRLDPSQVTITLRVWCETDYYWDVKARVTEKIKKELSANNIEIPFNQLQIHMTK